MYLQCMPILMQSCCAILEIYSYFIYNQCWLYVDYIGLMYTNVTDIGPTNCATKENSGWNYQDSVQVRKIPVKQET